MRPWLAAVSLCLNRMTGGPPNTYLCVRVAHSFGAHSWPCRLLDELCREPGHCRKILFWDRYQK